MYALFHGLFVPAWLEWVEIRVETVQPEMILILNQERGDGKN